MEIAEGDRKKCWGVGDVSVVFLAISLEYDQGHVGDGKVQVTVNAANGPHVFYIAVEDVFLWTRKVRQFLNTCRDYMVVGGTSSNEM